MSKKFYDIIISKKKDKNYKNYNCCSKNTTGPFSARVAKLDSNYLFKLNAFTSSFILFLFLFFVQLYSFSTIKKELFQQNFHTRKKKITGTFDQGCQFSLFYFIVFSEHQSSLLGRQLNDVTNDVTNSNRIEDVLQQTTLPSVVLFEPGLDGRVEIANYNKFMDEIFSR